ncbi:MAG: hypothetical protein H0W61_00850 [Bacteroidetes bacterium]|nr:hypothetical protein [Bacteroidota bacterium]
MNKLKEHSILLNRDQISELTEPLTRGLKHQAAQYVGVKPAALSRYFQYRVDQNGWVISSKVLEKLKEFINQIKVK